MVYMGPCLPDTEVPKEGWALFLGFLSSFIVRGKMLKMIIAVKSSGLFWQFKVEQTLCVQL